MASQAIKSGSRARQAGWAGGFTVALTAFLALTFHVNAIKSEVRLAERRIVRLEREKLLLETEFESRASQRQLAEWNAVEFGYTAPRADQFLGSERELASLSAPRLPDAPSPVRIAHAAPPVEEDSPLGEWVSPMTGKALADEAGDAVADGARKVAAKGAAALAEKLAKSARSEHAGLAEVAQ